MNTKLAGMISMASAITLGGCVATTTPDTDQRLGEAMSMLRAQQTLNPDAPRNTNPVAGLDGKAAKGALDNYRDSFRQPPAETNFLGIGGFGGGGK